MLPSSPPGDLSLLAATEQRPSDSDDLLVRIPTKLNTRIGPL
jgi:hypothetical protein